MDERSLAVIIRALARARDDGADDDWTARSILTALGGHGWRRVIEPPPAPRPPVPPPAEFVAALAAIHRHADHGPDVTCRPAGNGLCEPAPTP